MNRLRSTWMVPLLAGVLAVSLMLLAVSPPRVEAHAASADLQADWLRAQLRTPSDSDEAVQAALRRAAEASAPTLRAFLQTFVEAYAAEAPEASVAAIFTTQALSEEALIDLLQRRFHWLGGEGLASPLLLLAAASATSTLAQQRHQKGHAIFRADPQVSATPAWGYVVPVAPLVWLFRFLSSAQPLGP